MADSKPYLIGEVLEPAYFVHDMRYRSKVTQLLEHPFYRLRREQNWSVFSNKEYDGRTAHNETVTTKVGMTKEKSQEMELTIGMSLTADMGMKIDPKLTVKMIGI